ncbi:FxSxx-COOH system tetratricopeptide repeat protein [Nocardiopsis metallicus]|uniref:Tetratricopeptide (TPR) repeat protein n=1 Tax=Nocardiopsis metallicus TaxID=179819 RepID=A0A840WVU5_9ACTN|nr:FxSxx-COOH system tetratricopeptide repeat protein [Nocardiopsis metallicus]MBB5494268.1 tetratricopeptide (TPR) repeat protein [Nocardiopsis metallicus]
MSEGAFPLPPGGRLDGSRTGIPFGDLGLSATDLADALYLAAVMKRSTDAAPARYAPRYHAPDTEPLPEDPGGLWSPAADGARGGGAGGGTWIGTDGDRVADTVDTGPDATGATVQDAPLLGEGAGLRRGSPAPSRQAVQAGAPEESELETAFAQPVLQDRQRLLSALSPFNLRTPQGPADQIDPEGTARNYARALLDSLQWDERERESAGVPIVPATRRRRPRSVRLTVLVDDGVSMLFQQGVAGAFGRMLQDSGVFREVRRLYFDSERTGEPRLVDSRGRVRRIPGPEESGPRITLVLTGGLGTAWGDREFQSWLADLGARSAVAVVHLLQPQVWRRGTLRTVPTEIRMSWPAAPGAPNRGYLRERTITEVGEEEAPFGTLIPVLPLWPGALHDWASFVMYRSRSRLWVHTAEFPAREQPHASPPDPPEGARGGDAVGPAESDWAREVRRFQQSVSPEAFDLAVALAAVPLHPRMVKAVCADVLGGASPSELTEVFFSGLIRQVEEPGTGGGVEGRWRPREARWEFREGVRRELLLLGGRVPEVLRMLWLAAEHLRDLDPWFEELPLLLLGRRPENPRRTPVSRYWMNSMSDALDSVSISGFRFESANITTELTEAQQEHENHPPRSTSRATAPREFGLDSQSSGSAHEDSADVPLGARPRTAPGSTEGSPENPESQFGGENMTDSLASASRPTELAGRSSAGGRPRAATWVQVPHRNASFVGREGLLNSLREQLLRDQQQVITALRGMSGVGKTEMAKEYLYRNAAEYDLICWIPAQHINQVRNSFAHIAASFGIGSAGADNEYIVSEVLEALRQGSRFRRWLLIYDNAQSRAEIQRFLPVGGEGHVIITSRDGSWELPGGYGSMSIREFDRDESIQLLRRRGPRSLTANEAEQLAEELGDLPLALNQAAVWLHESGMSAADYLEQFARKKEEMIRLLEPEDPDYQVPVAAAWNVSLDRLAVTNPGALRLLQLCSFLAASPIPKYVFEFARGIVGPPELVEVLEDPTRLNIAIRAIGRNSLAHIDHQQNSISLHRLVQVAVRAPMTPEERVVLQHCAHQLLGRAGPRGDVADGSPRYADLLPHVWASEAWDCEDPWMRRVVITLCWTGVVRGQAQEIIKLCQVTYDTWQRTLGDRHPDTLSMAIQLSRALQRLGRLTEARELCGETLATMREVMGDDDPEVMEAERENIRNLWLAGRFHDGLIEATASLDRRIRLFGEDDPWTLMMARVVAFNEQLTGFPDRAVRRYEEALRRFEIVQGHEHIRTLGTVNGYAEALMEDGRYQEAERVQADLVERCQVLWDEDDVQLLINIAAWSVMLRRAGHHQEAYEQSRYAWERVVALQGRGSSQALYIAMVHARSLRTIDRFDEALKLAEDVADPYTRLLGEHHPYVAAANVNRALIMRRLSRPAEALVLDSSALELMSTTIGNDHPNTLACRVNLANNHFMLGEVETAREMDEQALVACRTKLGERHPLTLLAERNHLLSRKGLGEDVAEEYAAVRRKYQDVMGPQHPSTRTLDDEVRGDADIYVSLV